MVIKNIKNNFQFVEYVTRNKKKVFKESIIMKKEFTKISRSTLRL